MSNMRKTPPSGGTGGRSEQIQGHAAEHEAEIVRLQDQLTDLLFQTDGDDIEALDDLLAQLDELDPLPDGLLSSPEEALERFHWRHASVFESVRASESSASSSSSGGRRFHKPFVKILPIAAIVVLLLCTISAQAFGQNVFSAFVRWTSEIFRLNDSSASVATICAKPLEEGETAYYDSLEDALAAFGIDAPIVPQEIPERFKLVDVSASQWKAGVRIYADYENDSELFQIQYKEEKVDSFALEKENGLVNPYLKRDIIHYLVSDLGRQKAIWQNGDLECSLYGDVSEQEIKSMIDSMYKE